MTDTALNRAIDLNSLRTASFAANDARYGGGEREVCCLCSKPVKDFAEMTSTWTDGSVHTFTVARFYVNLINGGDAACDEQVDDSDAGYCGAFPVGSDCAKRARRAGVFVHEVQS